MASNGLIPYSSSLFNPVTAWTGAQPDLKLSYPSWMTDSAARGIGNNYTPDYAAPVPAADNGVVAFGGSASAPAVTSDSAYEPVTPVAHDGGMNGTGEAENAPGAEATGSLMGDAKGLFGGLGQVASDAYGSLADKIGGALGLSTGDAQGGAAPDSGSDGGYGGAGDHAETAPNFKGGILTRNKLIGPDPAGPDDGFASVESGEGVLTRKALKHYGPGIVGRLNKLMVDKAALR